MIGGVHVPARGVDLSSALARSTRLSLSSQVGAGGFMARQLCLNADQALNPKPYFA